MYDENTENNHIIRRWHLKKKMLPSLWILFYFKSIYGFFCRSQWPRGLRRRSAAARLLRSWVRIPPLEAGMFVCCECCVLSRRDLCDELITHPEESYRLWFVVVCDLETLRMRRPWPALGRSATGKKKASFTSFSWIVSTFVVSFREIQLIFQSGYLYNSGFVWAIIQFCVWQMNIRTSNA